MNLLQRRLQQFADKHGSIRAAARVLQVDHAYLSRLIDGTKANPSEQLLRKVGLRRLVSYSDRTDLPILKTVHRVER